MLDAPPISKVGQAFVGVTLGESLLFENAFPLLNNANKTNTKTLSIA